MKQEALAISIGTSRQSISMIEGSENIDEEKLKVIAEALGVSIEAIKNYTDEGVFNYFITFNDITFSSSQGAFDQNNNCTFNPLDKVIELYGRLVQVEKEKVEYLEKLFKVK
ncbi:helix-turn-helix transcriptional regulator [Flavobacterium pectinovorum]|uniref:helix-turn-helix domain-containing protein n=1 Tax=Flavobacterium pectinovorum TaxID=29533 RepID=UPI00265FA16D|nr:helix-turn-helix transcriptional regulator [Flavobacterium pectinovorum]WKL47505.1 helix-turn-helix transcriptional regulator [Flavobacterium pectinovorum]